jgi:hypothetical protein
MLHERADAISFLSHFWRKRDSLKVIAAQEDAVNPDVLKTPARSIEVGPEFQS